MGIGMTNWHSRVRCIFRRIHAPATEGACRASGEPVITRLASISSAGLRFFGAFRSSVPAKYIPTGTGVRRWITANQRPGDSSATYIMQRHLASERRHGLASESVSMSSGVGYRCYLPVAGNVRLVEARRCCS